MSTCNCNGSCHRTGVCGGDNCRWFYPGRNIDDMLESDTQLIIRKSWNSEITVSDIINDMKELNAIRKIRSEPFY